MLTRQIKWEWREVAAWREWLARRYPDRPAPPELHEQYRRGEISESDYRWLCGKEKD